MRGVLARLAFWESKAEKLNDELHQTKVDLRKAVTAIEWTLKQKIPMEVRNELMKVYPSLRK